MEPDYKALGFKCGLEIHQQLSGKKLFCDCPAINSTKEPDMKMERSLRAVAGETGIVDAAAEHESKKARKFIYVGNSEDVCLVEFDEEPPHGLNKDALATVVEVAQLLNAKIVDEIQVMRKTVVDGSNTSGFQRTALVGYDGYIDTSKGRIRIPSICIEEEAAQKLDESKDHVTYKLDRLGIALIEIGTEPDIVDPEHAKGAAELLGQILRSTGKVKRGLGTIRQDVNISIKGGARTEIKGFQDLKSIPKVIKKEIERQEHMIKQGKKPVPEVRKAESDFTTSFLRPMPGAARMYPETDVRPVRPSAVAIEKKEIASERAKRYERDFNLGKDLATAIAKSEQYTLFESIAKLGVKPAFVAETLISYPKELCRDYQGCEPAKITGSHLIEIFSALAKGTISKEAVMKSLVDIAQGKSLDLVKYKTADTADIESDIRSIVEQHKGATFAAVMGFVMKEMRGKADGKVISDIVRKHLI
jgi:Glu-tRNA(Gln) amidotransferase subunit E-like FAD-binding protein